MVFRRGLAYRPINSIKKVVDISGALVDGTTSITPWMDTVDGAAWVDAGDASVPQGSTIKSVFWSVYVFTAADGSAIPLIDFFLMKDPGTELTLPTPGATGGTKNRRWILHEEKGLAGNQSGTPMIFKGVTIIPRKMQRNGRDDRYVFSLVSNGFAGFFCAKFIYKFYT